MTLDSIVNVTISLETLAPTEANFGVPLIAAYHTAWVTRVREFSDPAELLSSGMTTRDAAYQAAKKMWSQSPHPDRFKIGRRDDPPAQLLHLTPINITVGFVYEFSVIGPDMAVYDIEYTVETGDAVADICAAFDAAIQGVAAVVTSTASETFNLDNNDTLIIKVDGTIYTVTFVTGDFVDINAATAEEVVTAINQVPGSGGVGFTLASGTSTVSLTSPTIGGPNSTVQVLGGTAAGATKLNFPTTKAIGTGVEGLNSTDSTTHVVLSPITDGELYGIDTGTLDPLADMAFADVTADPGLEDDLNAIVAADNEWYGFGLDSNSPAEVAVALAWTEAQIKIGYFDSSESEIVDSDVDTDLFSDALAAGYARSYLQFSKRMTKQWGAASLMSLEFSKTPGTYTLAHKSLRSITVDELATTYKATILAKGGNYYRVLAGLNLTFNGQSPSGEWIDTTRFIDFIHSRLQTDTLGVLANNDAVPFTDTGAQLLTGTVRGRLLANVSTENQKLGFAPDPLPFCTAPRVADVSVTNRANRHFPDIAFGARLSGAVHTLDINGKVTV